MMLGIKEVLLKILQTDLVIASGVDSNGWNYKKYSSGLLEAERVWNVGNYTINTVEVSPFRVGGTVTSPLPTMAISGNVVTTLMGNSVNSAVFLENIANNSWRIAKASSGNVSLQNLTVHCRVVNGKWK